MSDQETTAGPDYMLGHNEPFAEVPFFWSQHYDVPIADVGYAGKWDRTVVEGDIAKRDCSVTYYRDSRVLATATIYRDQQSLTTELAMERALDLDPAGLVPISQEG